MSENKDSKKIIREIRLMEEDVRNGVKESRIKNKYYNLRYEYPKIYKKIIEKQDLTNVYDVLNKMIDVIDGKKTLKEVADYASVLNNKKNEKN